MNLPLIIAEIADEIQDPSETLNRAWLTILVAMAECSYCDAARRDGSDACDGHAIWPPRTAFFGPEMVSLLMEMDFHERTEALEKIERLLDREASQTRQRQATPDPA